LDAEFIDGFEGKYSTQIVFIENN